MSMSETTFSSIPLYQQVRDHLVKEIAAGTWPVGSAMPNEVELARSLKVSPGTMRKALDKMEAELMLERTQGRGTFVKRKKPAHLCPECGRAMGQNGS